MSEYCERCVHTDAEIARLTKERDEARKLAYIGEHHFPDLTWKVRCAEAAADIASLRAQVARLQAEGAAMREALVSIEEYWNRNPNERAMQDACDHAIETARRALNNLPERNDGE